MRPHHGQIGGEVKPRILLLTSSLLSDRMILFTRVLETLQEKAEVEILATSACNPRFASMWQGQGCLVRPFPEVGPYKHFPYNYLRRINEFTWDFRLRPPTRISIMRHWRQQRSVLLRALEGPARLLALMRMERALESWLERLLSAYPRSPEARGRLRQHPPDLVVTTCPFWFHEPAIVAAAKRMNIPTMSLIPSWDNITTKNRMVFRYDGYILWSEQARRELHTLYPDARDTPAYVVGAPQFDVFFREEFHLSRQEFCARMELCADLPIVVYAVGSPNLFDEKHGAIDMARRVAGGELGQVQLLVRPHPIHDRGELREFLKGFGPRVVVQRTDQPGAPSTRSQDARQVMEWVNTFRHADVLVNLSSTVTVEAALCDCPVVNLDYDPEPGSPNQAKVRDVNHLWTHFKPVAESGGVWLVNNPDETAHAVKTYLARPELHRKERRWIVEYVCGRADGGAGERMGHAVLDFLQRDPLEVRR